MKDLICERDMAHSNNALVAHSMHLSQSWYQI